MVSMQEMLKLNSCPYKSRFWRKKILAEIWFTQRWKDVVRYFVKLRLFNEVTKLALRCLNIASSSLFKVAVTLSNDLGVNFQPTDNVDTTNSPSLRQRCGNVFVFGIYRRAAFLKQVLLHSIKSLRASTF